jgi:hypothetical protein
MATYNSTFTFDIVEHIATIEKINHALQLQFNYIKFGDNEPKYDIRYWSIKSKKGNRPNRMLKGITLNRCQLIRLRDILDEYLKDEPQTAVDLPTEP